MTPVVAPGEIEEDRLQKRVNKILETRLDTEKVCGIQNTVFQQC